MNKEIEVYNYPIFESPYFFVQHVESMVILDEGNFKIYSTKNGKMCWATKTPCSYYKNVKSSDFLGLKMVYHNDW